jgi:phosphoribosylformimino-5-aminoimidazole carboxamide ribotide isomerase
MQVIPSIDIINGESVRLLKGDYGEQTTYAVRPKEVARQYIAAGARSLHVVDLDGAKKGHVQNWVTITEILSLEGAEIQVGGGIRTHAEIERLLSAGAKRVVLGSLVIKAPDVLSGLAETFGPEHFCIALDLKDGRLAYQGWLKSSRTELAEIVSKGEECGIRQFLSTDISKDGMLGGPNTQLYASLVQRFPNVSWLASGGVNSSRDIVALKQAGVSGAVVGKALFEGVVRLEELLEAAC